jgi:citrate synthase
MLHDHRPSDAAARALDTYLVTVSDHGLNASTFTARVVASTQAGLGSSMLAALGALKGPLHGGAPGPVLDMLDAVGRADRADAVLSRMLDRGERLMGFGHRVYRVRDPRADALKAALAGLQRTDRLELALAVEQTALRLLRERKPDRRLETNVEFYTALLLDALGFPREAFTAVFAMGRVAGWIAHAREQATSGRLIRPKSRYVGPMPREAA